MLFQAFSYVAAAYLFYLGWGALRSKPAPTAEGDNQMGSAENTTDKKAFFVGLLTNGLNPKATLFFLSVFAVAVSPETPTGVKIIYGLYLSIATGLWFCSLSYLLSSKQVRIFLGRNGHWFDRIMGVILILLAIKLVLPV